MCFKLSVNISKIPPECGYISTSIIFRINNDLTHNVYIYQSRKPQLFSVALQFSSYCKVSSSNMSHSEVHPGFFRLFMKGIFDPYVLWPFDKKLIFRIRTRDYTVHIFVIFTPILHVLSDDHWLYQMVKSYEIGQILLVNL